MVGGAQIMHSYSNCKEDQKNMHSGFCLGKAEIKYSKFLKKKSVEDSGQREKQVHCNSEYMFREAGVYWVNMYVGVRCLA